MITGVLILIIGFALGYASAFYLPSKKIGEKPFDKYKNIDGLFSTRQIRASKKGR